MGDQELEKKEDILKDNLTEGGNSSGNQEDSGQIQPLQDQQKEKSNDDPDEPEYLKEKVIEDDDELNDLLDEIGSTELKVSVGGKAARDKGQKNDGEQDAQAKGGTEKSEQQKQKETDEDVQELDNAQAAASKAGAALPTSKKEEGEEVLDEVDSNIGELALNTISGENAEEESENADRSFDTMDELKKLRGQSGEEETAEGKDQEPDQDDSAMTLWKKVEKCRKGNIYMAVVLAKELEAGKPNRSNSSRASRFFNSSGFNKTSDVVKLVGLGSATLGTFDTQYAGSGVSKGISLVSNMMQMVTSIRDFVKKIKGFKSIQGENDKDRKLNKLFSVIGMVSDLSMVLSKGAAIAKTIAGVVGKSGGVFTKIFTSKIMNYVTLFLNATSQIGGILGGSRGLMKAKEGLTKLSGREGTLWMGVEPIAAKYQSKDDDVADPQPPASAIEKKEEPSVKDIEGEPSVKKTEGEAADKKPEDGNPAQQQGGASGDSKKEGVPAATKEEREKRRRTATALLEREDLSDADKTKIMKYIAICRKYENTHANLVKGATGLAAAAVGFGSSIATGVHYGVNNEISGKITKYAGLAASLGGIAATGTKMGMDHHTKDKQSAETSLIQTRLMGGIKSLQGDEYGLRGISQSLLSNGTGEDKEKARDALKKYADVDGLLQGGGVDYDQLFKAPNMGAFQKLLVAGI